MKTIRRSLLLAFWAVAGTAAATAPPAAAQPPGERLTVPLSDPARPAMVEVSSLRGNITVEGYSGHEVVVESSAPQEGEHGDRADRETDKVPPGAAGMHRIPHGAELNAQEDHNRVRVEAQTWGHAADLRLRVPAHSSLHLSCVSGCTIQVSGVEGEMELSNINGPIVAHDIAGSVVAHSTNGDIKVAMIRVDGSKPMAFSTLNGNVDVTFPASLKALLRMRSDRGEIYTDFEVLASGRPVSEHGEGRRRHFDSSSEVQGTVGGGGPEILFKTFNGNILIHRAH